MYCSNCGEQLSENDQFCPNCGTKVEKDDNKVQDVNSSGIHPNEDQFSQSDHEIMNQGNVESAKLGKTAKILIVAYVVILILGWFCYVNNVMTAVKKAADSYKNGDISMNGDFLNKLEEANKSSGKIQRSILENNDVELDLNVPGGYTTTGLSVKTVKNFINASDASVSVLALIYSTKDKMLDSLGNTSFNNNGNEDVNMSDLAQKDFGNYTVYYRTITATDTKGTTAKQIRGIVPIGDNMVYAITIIGKKDMSEDTLSDFMNFTVKNKKGGI